MTDAQKSAMRATLDTVLEQTISSYHGFMESTVHAKAEALLDETFRSNLIENMAAAADAAATS